MKNTSWQIVSERYCKSIGSLGDYYHKNIIIPKSLKLLNLDKRSSVLDLGCGEGIFSRYIPTGLDYLGIDISPSLIKFAKKKNKNPKAKFLVGDITKNLRIDRKKFSHTVILLAIQNIENAAAVIHNASSYLCDNGKILIVMNHPCFRIPRQSSWGIDRKNKIQFRRINRYLSPLKIPINMNPGDRAESKVTWSFHQPISYYSEALFENGFSILKIEEWISDKESSGIKSKMENRARQEFPLFMAILGSMG